jgi:hypothetical protein
MGYEIRLIAHFCYVLSMYSLSNGLTTKVRPQWTHDDLERAFSDEALTTAVSVVGLL